MIKIENVDVMGWKHAIRGMRNPKNSWNLSDTHACDGDHCDECPVDSKNPFLNKDCFDYDKTHHVGPNDHKLMMSLAKGGPVHAKYRRMITVYMDVTAPLYWWKEYDTYKVGTVANSCSTMHKIHAKEFTLEDFSHEHLVSGWTGKDKNGNIVTLPGPIECLENIVTMLNRVRNSYLIALETEPYTGLSAKDIWWQMIQLLPTSYNQKRTLMLNYEVLHNIYHSRKHHKLDEWHVFCDMIENLPYSEIITGDTNETTEE